MDSSHATMFRGPWRGLDANGNNIAQSSFIILSNVIISSCILSSISFEAISNKYLKTRKSIYVLPVIQVIEHDKERRDP